MTDGMMGSKTHFALEIFTRVVNARDPESELRKMIWEQWERAEALEAELLRLRGMK